MSDRLVSVRISDKFEKKGDTIYVYFEPIGKAYSCFINSEAIRSEDIPIGDPGTGKPTIFLIDMMVDTFMGKAVSNVDFYFPKDLNKLSYGIGTADDEIDSCIGKHKGEPVYIEPMSFVSEIVRLNDGLVDFTELVREGVPLYLEKKEMTSYGIGGRHQMVEFEKNMSKPRK